MAPPTAAPFVQRVEIVNYRSIGACDVELGPLMFLVGPNGSGKSNFLDALRFVADSLRTSIDHALRDRGGIKEVRRRSSGHPTHFSIKVSFALPSGVRGRYGFKIGAREGGAFTVAYEECQVGPHSFVVKRGVIEKITSAVAPPAFDDRLYLVVAAGLPAFRPVFDAFSQMGFYNLNPERIRAYQTPDRGDLLARDGSNLASVLHRFEREAPPWVMPRIQEYLARVVPGVVGVQHLRQGAMETLEFQQRIEGSPQPWRFAALNMSDGTLRAAGLLVALFQRAAMRNVILVGIEEPEGALHPAAAGALRDCIREGARHTQVIVTSHSPELLDDRSIDPEMVLAVTAEEGTSRIAPLDDTTRGALRDKLSTAGELLRSGHLTPREHPLPPQLDLFEEDAA